MKDTTAILDIAYPEVEEKIKINLNKYKQFMSKFISNRSKELYSNMPSKQMYYSDNDVAEFFKATGIDINIIKDAISKTYYATIANFNPRYAKDESTVALLCLVRYFKNNHMTKELDLVLINMAFSGKYYPSLFYRSYPIAEPSEHIMEYVINHMLNNKYDIVKQGTVIGAVRSVAKTWSDSYNSRFKDFHDDDCTYLIQQLHNRVGSFVTNIAEIYYKVYEDKNFYITYDSDDVSQDEYHLADNDSFKIERIVQNTMSTLTQNGIDYKVCKIASNDLVKLDELKSIIEMIIANPDNTMLLKEYVALLVTLYFRDNKEKDVRSIRFISYSIKATPNSHDKYILRKKELLDQILINNSEHFTRRRSRVATESAYYRSINAYLSLTIQNSNK